MSTESPLAQAPAGDSGDLGLRVPLHGLRLIEASAGTGKTFVLVTLLLRLLLERGLPLPQMLAVTFTRAAAQELRTRLRQRLLAARRVLEGERIAEDDAEAQAAHAVLERAAQGCDAATLRLRLQTALLQLDEALVSTIHGFCQRTLREFGFRAGMLADAALVDAAPDAWAETAAQLWRRAAGADDDTERHALLRALWKTPTALARDLPALCDGARVLLPAPAESAQAATLHRLRRSADDLFARIMARRGERTQDQLIAAVWRASADPGFAAALAERWPVLLIDEFQDTDPRQWDIFRRMFAAADPARRLLCLIGDPKQAIYRFRGGDLETYLQACDAVAAAAANDASAAGAYALDANYRSRPQLLQALECVFGRHEDPFRDAPLSQAAQAPRIRFHRLHAAGSAGDADLRVDAAPEPALTIHWLGGPEPDRSRHHASNAYKGFRDKDDEFALMCAAAVAQIARLLAGGTLVERKGHVAGRARALRPGDIAVLARSNDEAMRLHRALAAAGLPSALLSKEGVFDGEVAQMLRTVLRALAAPGDAGLFRAALATPLLGFDAQALLDLAHEPQRLDAEWSRFERAALVWRSRGPLPALMPFATAAAARWLGEQGGARRLTDLLHLLELLQAEAPQQHGPLELLRWLEAQIDAPGDAADTRQLRLEADADLIQIGTIHRAKGLEYPVVVLPFAAWLSRPKAKTLRRYELHVADDGDAHASADAHPAHVRRVPARAWAQNEVLPSAAAERFEREAAAEEAAEQQRLLYVALTRARHALHIVWSRNGSTQDTALHWLLHHGARMDRKDDTLDAAGMRARLMALESEAGGAIRICDIDTERLPEGIAADAARASARIVPQAAAAPARIARRRLGEDARLHSFSSLHSRIAEAWSVSPGDSADPDAERGAADEQVLGVAATLEADDDALGGSAFGDAVHAVLEAADFAAWASTVAAPAGAPAATARGVAAHAQGDLFVDGAMPDAEASTWPRAQQPLLERALRRAGLTPSPSHLTQTARLVRAALNVPLPGGVRLRSLPATRCVREMGFHFRLRPTRVDALFALLDAHGYPRAQRPPAQTLVGYMHGWIDLVYRDDDGRHYVLDYKTNRLPAYAPQDLDRAVRRRDYDLQYLIYLLALYRWLRQRRGARFDPARDLGGAVYVFLRGVERTAAHPARDSADDAAGDDGLPAQDGGRTGIAAGVHWDPVSPELLAALDALFDGREGCEPPDAEARR